MSWPLSQDYNEAIQSPARNFADADLKRGEVATNPLGLPMPYSGNFADVYQVTVPDGWTGRRITLTADYVNSLAVVYLDGRKVGEVRFPGGEVDLTAACRPGATHTLEVNLANDLHHSYLIQAWRLAAAGDYTLALRYHYDRAQVKKDFGKGCPDIDGANRPWNRALEIDQKVEVKLRVAEK